MSRTQVAGAGQARYPVLSMAVFAVTIFLAAFLLFQVQPVIAKIILPWFGGSSAVWSTCMLFFQTVLLAGYLYAHWLHEKLSGRKQAVVHSALLLAGLIALPIMPDASWQGAGLDHPFWQILKLLAVSVGLPYFLLSATSPLLQAWYARSYERAVPYRLYALSNLASLLALGSYPVLVEPKLTVQRQTALWSVGYVSFTLLSGATAWLGLRKARTAPAGPDAAALSPAAAAGWGARLFWVTLAACASILLLSVTSFLTQDVAAIPFLWILPLSIYLLSFILCFEAPWLYYRPVYFALLALGLAGMGYALYWSETSLRVPAVIAVAGGSLFICCMVCHGELSRTKPAPRYLTSFYVMVSIGGALGGLIVGFIAPNFFNASYELPAGLSLCGFLVAAILLKANWRASQFRWGRAVAIAVFLLACGYTGAMARGVREQVSGSRVVARNFYGQLRVYDVDQGDGVGVHRKLMHGVINHGEQVLSEQYRRKASTYYCPGTGIGDLLAEDHAGAPRRIGLLGLGCGTLAAYGKPGDVFEIYEINPLVVQLARTQFTYIEDTPAKVETVMGDARLALDREPDQRFDVLIMDAFSGDSVPVHLITREAFRTYFRHMKADGIVAVNISNKYLDLRPVTEGAARSFGRIALVFEFTPDDEDPVCFGSAWVLLMNPKTRDAHSIAFKAGKVLERWPGFRMWTDDYSGMFGILK
jgi:hypothetical protein